jgi:hypothetical protein
MHMLSVLLVLLQNCMSLPAAVAADILQLAMNGLNVRTAYAVLRRPPSQLEPTAARRLLLTAAVRQRGQLVRQVAAVPAVQQHLDAPTLSAVLRTLLLGGGWRALYDLNDLLRDQQAVAFLRGGTLVEVLHAAVASRAPGLVEPLFKSPNARQLGVAAVLELLSAAAGALDSYSVRRVSSLPAATQLSCEDVMRLLLAAIEANSVHGLNDLYSLPGAEQLESLHVVRLLQAAIVKRSADVVRGLASLPAAQQLSSGDVAQLLQAAAEACDAQLVCA